jgi:putative spermidine/putrescine transport system permease protein
MRGVSPTLAVLWVATVSVLVFLVAPIVIIVIASFNDSQILSFPLERFSVRWYRALFNDRQLIDAFNVSVVVGAITTVLSILVGVPAAFSINRYSFRGRDLLNAFILSPLLIPLIVLGLAVLLALAALGLRPSLVGFVCMHVVITVPYIVRTVLATLERFDLTLEEVALSLGADDLRTKRYVTLPLIKPGIIAGGFFAFMTSFDNVPVSIFLGSAKLTTLPVKIYSQTEAYGIDPVFAAISTVVIVLTLLLMLLLDRYVGLDHLREG